MERENTQQQPDGGPKGDAPQTATGEKTYPSPEEPDEFLTWLRDDTSSSSAVVHELPVLIDKVQKGGKFSWSAGKCITHILEAVESPVDCPELAEIIDHDHVNTSLVLAHLDRIYPRNEPVLDHSIDTDVIEDLPPADRMNAYRVLSRLPPNEDIYDALEQTDEMFDGTVNVGQIYPVGGFFRTYAMRCLRQYIEKPHRAPAELASRAVRDHPDGAVRLVAANITEASQTDVVDPLADALEKKPVPDDFYNGQIISELVSEFIHTQERDRQETIGRLIMAALQADVSPAGFKAFIPDLVEYLQTNNSAIGGEVLSEILASAPPSQIDSNLLDTIVNGAIGDRQDLWMPSLKVLAWSSSPGKLDPYLGDLVQVMRESNGRLQSELSKILATVAQYDPEVVYSEIEPLVRDLANSTSAREVIDTGRILKVLEVYPPPPQLFALYGSTNEEIDKKAKKLVAELRKRFREGSPDIDPGEVESLQSLSEDFNLVQRAGPISWESPSLTSSRKSILGTVSELAALSVHRENLEEDTAKTAVDANLGISPADFIERDHSFQMVVPSYDPDWFEYAVIGVILAQVVHPQIRAAIHSPAINGWGTKKDLKEALQQYALVPADNPTEVIPLLDLVPTARVTDSGVEIETSSTTIADDPPALALIRDIEKLAETSADIQLYNYLPGIDAKNATHLLEWRGKMGDNSQDTGSPKSAEDSEIDGYSSIADQASLEHLSHLDERNEVKTDSDNNPVQIEIYSLFTAQYGADRKQYIGPPTDLPVPASITQIPHTGEESENGQETDNEDQYRNQIAAFSGPSQVDLYAIQSDDEIGELLAKIDEFSEQMNDQENQAALKRFQYTIESLPVPVKLHDHWIQQQIDQGNRYVPRQISDRRNGIQALSDDGGFDSQLLEEATITIDTLLDRLEETNPLVEHLISVLDEAASQNRRVGLLCGKKTYKEMLDLYLTEHASDWDPGDDLLLLDEDTLRQIEPEDIDWLVTFGPLPPQTAIYYHHPLVERVITLAHADGSLDTRISGIDARRRPFLPHSSNENMPELDLTTYGSTLEVDEESKTFTDDLYRTYLSVASQSVSGGTSHSESSGTISRYHLEFEDGTEDTLTDTHPIIVRSEEHLVSSGEFVLRSLSRISRGDEIVLVDRDARQELWEVFLRQDWEESDESLEAEEAFLDAVELWYEAVSAGIEAHSEGSSSGSGIRDLAREIEPEVSVATGTIEEWAHSVYQADSPSDLVFRSELRIGPRHADGIEAVAKTHGSERMAENWEQVFKRIKAIRATHRQRGSVFWEWLADRACDGELFDYPGVRQVTVGKCKKAG